jgi:hypothetical protein
MSYLMNALVESRFDAVRMAVRVIERFWDRGFAVGLRVRIV